MGVQVGLRSRDGKFPRFGSASCVTRAAAGGRRAQATLRLSPTSKNPATIVPWPRTSAPACSRCRTQRRGGVLPVLGRLPPVEREPRACPHEAAGTGPTRSPSPLFKPSACTHSAGLLSVRSFPVTLKKDSRFGEGRLCGRQARPGQAYEVSERNVLAAVFCPPLPDKPGSPRQPIGGEAWYDRPAARPAPPAHRADLYHRARRCPPPASRHSTPSSRRSPRPRRRPRRPG